VTSDDRLGSAMPRITRAVHDLARELDLTNEELLAALAFLTEVARADEMILLSDILGLSRLVDDQTHAAALGTASNVLGPFYRPGAPWVDNPGSIVRNASAAAPGIVRGTVADARSGRPLAGAVVDVWQANAEGDYSNEDSSLNPWHLRGRQRTDADGRYAVETIWPSHYTVKHDGPVGRLLEVLERHPWRPAHIHFLVEADGYRRLVTQAYLAGGPYLEDDTIDGVKADLIVPVRDGVLSFDIALEPGA
jgi:protocatechuate 3,4-dioxygenase beta subunit